MKHLELIEDEIGQFINRILRRFGFELMKRKKEHFFSANIIDLRKSTVPLTPKDALSFKTDLHARYLFDIPTDLLIDRMQIIRRRILTLKLWEKEENNTPLENRKSFQYYREFYDEYQPKNVAEYLGLPEEMIEKHQRDFFNKDPMYAVSPWAESSPESRYKYALSIMKKEAKEGPNGFRYKKEKDGYKNYGPCSSRMIELEFYRLVEVYDSIKKNGFLEDHTFPKVGMFVDGDTYLYKSLAANHRTAACLALDYQTIPATFSNGYYNPIIYRSEVEKWSNVKSGLFTKEQALFLFDQEFVPLKKSLNTN